MYSVSFTGHRPEKLPFFGDGDPMLDDLKARIKEKIERLLADGARVFYCGMARGVDLWCGEIVVELAEKYPDISLCAVIPCESQSRGWNEADKALYDKVLAACSKKIYTSKKYTRDCMHKRDRALVQLCDILLAVYDGTSGGTGYTVEQARKAGKKIIFVDIM